MVLLNFLIMFPLLYKQHSQNLYPLLLIPSAAWIILSHFAFTFDTNSIDIFLLRLHLQKVAYPFISARFLLQQSASIFSNARLPFRCHLLLETINANKQEKKKAFNTRPTTKQPSRWCFTLSSNKKTHTTRSNGVGQKESHQPPGLVVHSSAAHVKCGTRQFKGLLPLPGSRNIPKSKRNDNDMLHRAWHRFCGTVCVCYSFLARLGLIFRITPQHQQQFWWNVWPVLEQERGRNNSTEKCYPKNTFHENTGEIGV